jgi:hypothetical protein
VKTRWLILGGGAIAFTCAIACRDDVPTGDPKTPANSPLPKIERKESDPKSPPTLGGKESDAKGSPTVGDAG